MLCEGLGPATERNRHARPRFVLPYRLGKGRPRGTVGRNRAGTGGTANAADLNLSAEQRRSGRGRRAGAELREHETPDAFSSPGTLCHERLSRRSVILKISLIVFGLAVSRATSALRQPQ